MIPILIQFILDVILYGDMLYSESMSGNFRYKTHEKKEQE